MTINPVAAANAIKNTAVLKLQNASAPAVPKQSMGMDSYMSTTKDVAVDADDNFYNKWLDRFYGPLAPENSACRSWESLTEDEQLYLKEKYNVNEMTADETLSMLTELRDMKLISATTYELTSEAYKIMVAQDSASPPPPELGYEPLSPEEKNDLLKNFLLRLSSALTEEEKEAEKEKKELAKINMLEKEQQQRLSYAVNELQKVVSNLAGGASLKFS